MSKLIWCGSTRRVEQDTNLGMVTRIGLAVGGGDTGPPRRDASEPPPTDGRGGALVSAEQLEPPTDPRSHSSGRFKL